MARFNGRKASDEVVTRMMTVAGCTRDDAEAWYVKADPCLGNISPQEMVDQGMKRNLMEFLRFMETLNAIEADPLDAGLEIGLGDESD